MYDAPHRARPRVPTGVAVGSVAVCFAGGLTSAGALCLAATARTARYARRA